MAKDKNEKAEGAEKVELSPEEAAAKAKKRKLLVIIIAGVLVTIGVGGGLAFFLSKSPSPNDQATSDVSPESQDQPKETEPPKKEDAKTDKKDEKKDEKADATNKDEKKEAAVKLPQNVDIGCTHQFKSFNLNLGNPLENRYIRLELAIEHGCAEEDKNEVKLREPQLRDAIINVISKKTREFLLSPDGKAQLTYEIRNQINQRMSRPVKDVYITDILIE